LAHLLLKEKGEREKYEISGYWDSYMPPLREDKGGWYFSNLRIELESRSIKRSITFLFYAHPIQTSFGPRSLKREGRKRKYEISGYWGPYTPPMREDKGGWFFSDLRINLESRSIKRSITF